MEFTRQGFYFGIKIAHVPYIMQTAVNKIPDFWKKNLEVTVLLPQEFEIYYFKTKGPSYTSKLQTPTSRQQEMRKHVQV